MLKTCFHFIYLTLVISHGLKAQLIDLNSIVQNDAQETFPLEQLINQDSNYILFIIENNCDDCFNTLANYSTHQAAWQDEYQANIIVLDISPGSNLNTFYLRDSLSLKLPWFKVVYPLVDQSKIGNTFLLSNYVSTDIELKSLQTCIELEQIMQRFFRTIRTTSLYENNWSQSIKTRDCQDWGVLTYTDQTISNQNGRNYFYKNALYIREDSVSGDLIQYKNDKDSTYINYNSGICTRHHIEDHLGNEISYMIVDIEVVDGLKHLITNRMVQGACGETYAWRLIQGMGSNAGLFFEIEGEHIVTQLICHVQNGQLLHENPNYAHLCGLTSLAEVDSKQIKVYPNPSDDRVYLSAPANYYELIHPSGIVVQAGRLSSQEINLNVDPGLYILKLLNAEKKYIHQSKIILW